jgi:quercetin dioxygenase-like cupin family protein
MTFPEPPAVWQPRTGNETTELGLRFVAPGTRVNGEFGLFENFAPAGHPGPPAHYHQGFSESFYVLSGRLAILTGRSWQVAGSGDFAYVPAHGVHSFRAVGDEDAKFMILFVPGAPRERFFRGMAEFARRPEPPTRAELDAFALDCDQVNLHDWVSDPLL